MATGTPGNDRWKGTAEGDVFSAGKGNDVCIAGQGNDRVIAGFGNDLVTGGGGGDTILGGAGKDDLRGGAGDDDIDAGAGNDIVKAGAGSDTVVGGSGKDKVYGEAGDDNLEGGAGNDTLDGGDGDDFIAGNTGNDIMIGGNGNDTLDWDDLDGSDIMSGNAGEDTIEVDGSVSRGDNFRLQGRTDGIAFFERTGLDGQPIGQISLTVDTSEIFDVSGEGGNDTFSVLSLAGTGVSEVQFDGGAGNDWLDGKETNVHLVADGGEGDDILTGGTGTTIVTRPDGTNIVLGDTLTGGTGRDQFRFLSDPFAGSTPGQPVNQTDVITDFTIGEDQIVLGKQRFGINEFRFQSGNSNQLSGDKNLIVLTDGFANAGAASQAIANSGNTADAGVFVYFNQTLGISRVVFSQDLGDGGRFSVLGNLTNQTNLANQANFTAAEFTLV